MFWTLPYYDFSKTSILFRSKTNLFIYSNYIGVLSSCCFACDTIVHQVQKKKIDCSLAIWVHVGIDPYFDFRFGDDYFWNTCSQFLLYTFEIWLDVRVRKDSIYKISETDYELRQFWVHDCHSNMINWLNSIKSKQIVATKKKTPILWIHS